MAAYCAKSDPESDADDWMRFYKFTGGVDLVAVDKSERLHLEFRAKDRATPNVGFGKIDVVDGHPPRGRGPARLLVRDGQVVSAPRPNPFEERKMLIDRLKACGVDGDVTVDPKGGVRIILRP